MDTRTAFRLLVGYIPGTWETAARLCGNAVNPMREAWAERSSRYVPNVIDAQIVSDYAISLQTPHCYAYVEAVARNAGGRFELGTAGSVGDAGAKQLPGHTADLLRECSDVVTAVTAAMADGTLSANDRKAIRKELLELADAMKAVDTSTWTPTSARSCRSCGPEGDRAVSEQKKQAYLQFLREKGPVA